MTKKIFAAILAICMIASCMVFTASAAEKIYYVEQDATGGDGSKNEPFGTIDDALAELAGESGTVMIYGTYDVSGQFKNAWDGMLTICGADEEAIITLKDSLGITFKGDITFKDIKFSIGKYAHFNTNGYKLIMDGGEGSEFNSMMHLTAFMNAVVESNYCEFKSGTVATIYAGGGYSTSYANGCMGDSTFVFNGATVKNVNLAGDHYMDNQTGISIGGNLNLIFNQDGVLAISTKEKTQPEIMGALNFIFNNGTQVPEKFAHPEETVAGGVFLIKSAVGGTVMPTEEAGVFEVKADKGKIAKINGEQVLNGKVTLEAGETVVEWVDGEQPDESIKIELTIDSKEIITNGVKSELDVPAQIVDSRTLVPLRAIFEALGATVEWDGATSTVTSEKDGTKIKLTIGDNNLYVNGEAKALDVPAQIIESRTMVPARAIAEAYGCDVAWNGETRTVTITK